jgi:hypothetical protein
MHRTDEETSMEDAADKDVNGEPRPKGQVRSRPTAYTLGIKWSRKWYPMKALTSGGMTSEDRVSVVTRASHGDGRSSRARGAATLYS